MKKVDPDEPTVMVLMVSSVGHLLVMVIGGGKYVKNLGSVPTPATPTIHPVARCVWNHNGSLRLRNK